MKKYVLSFLFLLVIIAAFGQDKPKPAPVIRQKKPAKGAAPVVKRSIVYLIKSDDAENIKDATGKNLTKVHHGIFRQDNSIMESDSSYFYPEQNAMDAFGHVHITQGDTLNIYSDKLNYNGNTKEAILTDHVKMIEKDAILTTDYLTYNTGTKIATYTNGGKLVNKDNTLTSKNGYYFASSRDAYFRYNVVCTTPDALIKSDTLRYNTKTRISYFYGPSNIYGKKDKDTLYTENGDYNTVNEQARFGKKNRYSQGTKSLKGDSLFYDKLKGYGRAVKHITFNDNEQKVTIKGDLGEFYKADDRAVVTQNAYAVFVIEDKDSTKTDSAKVRSIPTKADSVNKKLAIGKADPLVKKLGLKTDSLNKKPAATKTDPLNHQLNISKSDPLVKKLGLKADSVAKKTGVQSKPTVAGNKQVDKPNTVPPKGTMPIVSKTEVKAKDKADSVSKFKIDTIKHGKVDSMFMAADTLETQIVTYKDLKATRKARFEANNPDTTIKVVKTVLLTKPPKMLSVVTPALPPDTTIYHRLYFGSPKPKVVKKKPVKPVDIKKLKADSAKRVRIADSLTKIADHGLVDTSRIRTVSGHHHAKIFKSDLQAIADSMFFAYSDSTIRMYNKPMIWTQGSQMSGDSINLQMKNRKLDNMDMFPAAFIVNIEKGDSVHFNQMGGAKMHINFKDSKLSRLAVNGNAETIGFTRDSVTHKVKDFTRSLSTGLVVNFVNGSPSRTAFYSKPDNRALPFEKSKEDERVLKGFLWKPKDRPASKEAIINTYKPPVDKKSAAAKEAAGKGAKPNGAGKGAAGKKVTANAKETVPAAKPLIAPVTDTGKMIKPDTLKKPDTTKTSIAPKLKGAPVK